MRIAVDAMGGDHGHAEVVRGVADAALNLPHAHFYLVGTSDLLETECQRLQSRPKNMEIVQASQVIEMGEKPTLAYRQKPDASITVAARMVREQKADALVTIGNTGAAMAISLLTLGRIKGIDRPAIATPLPTKTGRTAVLLDAGATVDCDPNNLYEFAVMGSLYAENVIGIPKPRVGLLSNGEETSKGNSLVKRAHQLFAQTVQNDVPFTFIGNVEGKDIFRGNVDVVVCDGFTGNILLKTAEGVAEMVMSLIREEVSRHIWMRPLVVPLMPALRRLRSRVDYAERGGAPLLGINGICIIGHGRSNAYAVTNACRAAERAVHFRIVDAIRTQICESPTPPPA